MMFVSLVPAMANVLTAKKAASSTEQSQSNLAWGGGGEFPSLQTLSTDAFTPTTNVERSGGSKFSRLLRQRPDLSQVVLYLQAKYQMTLTEKGVLANSLRPIKYTSEEELLELVESIVKKTKLTPKSEAKKG